MFDIFKKLKKYIPKTTNEYINELSAYCNEEKCEFVFTETKKLLTIGIPESLKTAEELLLYAKNNYFDVSDNNFKALVYYRLGELYEKHYDDFNIAYEAYEKYTQFNTKFGGTHSLLLRAILLRDNFAYSPELEKELKMSYGEIDLGLRSDRLFENIGSLIVTRNEGGKEELCEEYIKRIKNIVKADELLFPDFIFKKDTVRDILEVPQKVFDFVNSL